jgi:hypothetical protein
MTVGVVDGPGLTCPGKTGTGRDANGCISLERRTEPAMTLLSHLGHPLPRLDRTWAQSTAADRPAVDGRVYAVQRIGALGVGLFLAVFGLLGATAGAPFLSTSGTRVLGMSADGLLSALSLVVAVLLVGAALRGPRVASTTMIVLGVLFLVSALVNLALLRTALNLLAFGLRDVVFSVVVGLLLLVLGGYGRLSGNLPADSPYARPRPAFDEPPDLPPTPEEVAAEAAMHEAELAVVQRYATPEQQRRVGAMYTARTRADRRRIWLQCAAADSSGMLDD